MPQPKIKNYGSIPSVEAHVRGLFSKIEDGYKEGKQDQTDAIADYWDIYNTELTDNQIYDGDSQTFVPIVKDAIDARAKRFAALLFPTSGKNLECITESGDMPTNTISLLQHYIRWSKLRTKIPPLFLNGDIEGQWSLMVDWVSREHTVTRKVKEEIPGVPDFSWEDIREETVTEAGPEVTLIAAQELLIFPPTVDDIQDAEQVVVKFRWTEAQLKAKAKLGWLMSKKVDEIIDADLDPGDKWAGKQRTDDANVKIKGKSSFQLVYMGYAKLKLDGSKKVPAIFFLSSKGVVLGVVKNPYWSQKINIVSLAAEPVAGTIWGKPIVEAVADLQYQVNDVTNMGLDSALFALLPIVMTDPLKNPNVASMIMGKAAIWETSPQDTTITNFPPLYEHMIALKNDIKAQIMESMQVNEAMLGKAPAGRKNAQAVAQQSSEALATMNDVVKRCENGVMDPLLEWFYELDMQFRTEELSVVMYGEHGQRATMEKIPVQQWDEKYYFHWNGTDQLGGPQRMQQLISMINVFKGFTPDVLNGRKLDLGPAIDQIAQIGFGPTLAGQILIDQRHQQTIDPELENQFLKNNMDIPVSPMDDNQQHLKVHESAAHVTADPSGTFRRHIMAHIAAMQQQQGQPGGHVGAPGGQGGPGTAGQPRPGAQPAPPRGGQQPPGAVHQDQMQDAQAGMRG
jgi:hypothetical protein